MGVPKTLRRAWEDGLSTYSALCHNRYEGCNSRRLGELEIGTKRPPRWVCPTCKASGSPDWRRVDLSDKPKGHDVYAWTNQSFALNGPEYNSLVYIPNN